MTFVYKRDLSTIKQNNVVKFQLSVHSEKPCTILVDSLLSKYEKVTDFFRRSNYLELFASTTPLILPVSHPIILNNPSISEDLRKWMIDYFHSTLFKMKHPNLHSSWNKQIFEDLSLISLFNLFTRSGLHPGEIRRNRKIL